VAIRVPRPWGRINTLCCTSPGVGVPPLGCPGLPGEAYAAFYPARLWFFRRASVLAWSCTSEDACATEKPADRQSAISNVLPARNNVVDGFLSPRRQCLSVSATQRRLETACQGRIRCHRTETTTNRTQHGTRKHGRCRRLGSGRDRLSMRSSFSSASTR